MSSVTIPAPVSWRQERLAVRSGSDEYTLVFWSTLTVGTLAMP